MIIAASVQRCEVCDGFLNPNEPGHVESVTGDLQHSVCHERGEAPLTPLIEMSEGSKCCMNQQYNCGHYGYGPLTSLPDTCPECGDTAV